MTVAIPTWRTAAAPLNVFAPIAGSSPKACLPGVPSVAFDDYSGLAYDRDTGRVYSAAGAGHASGNDNGVYMLDLMIAAPRWTVLRANSKLSGATCADNAAYWSDGRPSGAHNYYSLQFVNVAGRKGIVRAVNAAGSYVGMAPAETDCFWLDTNDWDLNGLGWPPISTSNANINSLICADPRTSKIYVGTTQGPFWCLDPATRSWTRRIGDPSGGGWVASCIVPALDSFVWNKGFFKGQPGAFLGLWNLTTDVHTQAALNWSTPQPATWVDQDGFTVDDDGGKIYWINGSNFMRVDIKTWAAELLGTVPRAWTACYNRLGYVPALKGLYYQPSFASEALFCPTAALTAAVVDPVPPIIVVPPAPGPVVTTPPDPVVIVPPAPLPAPPPVVTPAAIAVRLSPAQGGTDYNYSSKALDLKWQTPGGDSASTGISAALTTWPQPGPNPPASPVILTFDISKIDGDVLLRWNGGTGPRWSNVTIDGVAVKAWALPSSTTTNFPIAVLGRGKSLSISIDNAYQLGTISAEKIIVPAVSYPPLSGPIGNKPDLFYLSLTSEAAVRAAIPNGAMAQPWAYNPTFGTTPEGMPYMQFESGDNQRLISWFAEYPGKDRAYVGYAFQIVNIDGFREAGFKLAGAIRLPEADGTFSWRLWHGPPAPDNPGIVSAGDYLYDADPKHISTGMIRRTADVTYIVGRWYYAMQLVQMNTFAADGTPNFDGIGEIWINGTLKWRDDKICWRRTPAELCNGVHINFYHGGLGKPDPARPLVYRLAEVSASTTYISPPKWLMSASPWVPPPVVVDPLPPPVVIPPPPIVVQPPPVVVPPVPAATVSAKLSPTLRSIDVSWLNIATPTAKDYCALYTPFGARVFFVYTGGSASGTLSISLPDRLRGMHTLKLNANNGPVNLALTTVLIEPRQVKRRAADRG